MGALYYSGPINICGDANDDESINLLDVTRIINYLYKGGEGPGWPDAFDIDGLWGCNLLDVTYLIRYLYKNGADPNCQ